jgi:zinc transport system ATP-binding protein
MNVAADQQAAVAFEDVTVSGGGVTILERVNAIVPRGGSTAIVGPNGAGKTTLLMALLGEIPHGGRVRLATVRDGRPPRIGYVPQRMAFDRGLPATVLEFLAMGRQRRPLWLGVARRPRERARDLLAAVRAAHLEGRPMGALSGGEVQRVLLALALQQDPDLLVLDEPAAGVDAQGEQIFCELLEGLRQAAGFTQLMVSHDLATVTHHATHVICLNRRVVAEGPPRQVLTRDTLTAIFGLHMGLVDHRAMPDGGTRCTAPCCTKEDGAHA